MISCILFVFAIRQIYPKARKEASRRCRPRPQRRSRRPRRQPSRLRCRLLCRWFLTKILVLCDSHSELWGCHHERISKIRRACSRLYRSRIFRVLVDAFFFRHLVGAFFFGIFLDLQDLHLCTLLHRSKFKSFAYTLRTFSTCYNFE